LDVGSNPIGRTINQGTLKNEGRRKKRA